VVAWQASFCYYAYMIVSCAGTTSHLPGWQGPQVQPGSWFLFVVWYYTLVKTFL